MGDVIHLFAATGRPGPRRSPRRPARPLRREDLPPNVVPICDAPAPAAVAKPSQADVLLEMVLATIDALDSSPAKAGFRAEVLAALDRAHVDVTRKSRRGKALLAAQTLVGIGIPYRS